jgi:hypothetical protein
LHGNKTLCESRDFFDAEIYLGKKQNSVSKSISNFFLFYGCAKYNDYVCIMKSFLDKIDDPGERTTNCNYKLHGTKVICNPRGYYNENPEFDPNGIIVDTKRL